MYRLLDIGEVVVDSDEWYDFAEMVWRDYSVGIPFVCVPEGCGPIRRKIEDAKELGTTPNTGSPKLSGAVCRWCYGHKDMCQKCVVGSEFSPAAQHRASA